MAKSKAQPAIVTFRLTNLSGWRSAVYSMREPLIELRGRFAGVPRSQRMPPPRTDIVAHWDFSTLEAGRLNLPALVLVVSQILRFRIILGVQSSIAVPESRKLQELLFHSTFGPILSSADALTAGGEPQFRELPLRDSKQRFVLLHFKRPIDLPDANSSDFLERRNVKSHALRVAWSQLAERVPFAFHALRNPTTGAYDVGQLRGQVLNAISELVANAWLWGQSDCVVGLQTIYDQTKRQWRSTLAVSDMGVGFRRALRHSAEHKQHFSSVSGFVPDTPDYLWLLAALYVNRDNEGLTRTLEVTGYYDARFWCAYGEQVLGISADAAKYLCAQNRTRALNSIVNALVHNGEVRRQPLYDMQKEIMLDPLHIRIAGVHVEFTVIHELNDSVA